MSFSYGEKLYNLDRISLHEMLVKLKKILISFMKNYKLCYDDGGKLLETFGDNYSNIYSNKVFLKSIHQRKQKVFLVISLDSSNFKSPSIRIERNTLFHAVTIILPLLDFPEQLLNEIIYDVYMDNIGIF